MSIKRTPTIVKKSKPKVVKLKKQPKIKPPVEKNEVIDTSVPSEVIKEKVVKERRYVPKKYDDYKKTVFGLMEKDYLDEKKFLLNRGDEFEVIQSGSIEKIKHDGKIKCLIDVNYLSSNGFHLSNLVTKDIIEWLEKKEKNLVLREKDYKEQFFNPDKIAECIGDVCISIDINDCYWQTAYNLGYISNKTYNKGLLKKGWKIGRNASIGSLIKTELITYYKNGEKVRDQFGKILSKPVKKPKNFAHIRHNIIGKVYDMFVELLKELENDYFMILTDCIFTSFKNQNKVQEFFRDNGYNSKTKAIEFTRLNKEEQIVEWVEIKNLGTPKYYRYAINQIYPKIITNNGSNRKTRIKNNK